MQFTLGRNAGTIDEIWYLQHPPVYTLGLAGKKEHLLKDTTIPVINTDRGGQITYHGPGQLIVYFLVDLVRKNFTVKHFVSLLEQLLIEMCDSLSVAAERRVGAPGVYVNDQKIAALGIRIKHGCSYHGIALNVNMDLSPFKNINPCGYPGLQVTQISEHGCWLDVHQAFSHLLPHLLSQLDYEKYDLVEDSIEMLNKRNVQAA